MKKINIATLATLESLRHLYDAGTCTTGHEGRSVPSGVEAGSQTTCSGALNAFICSAESHSVY